MEQELTVVTGPGLPEGRLEKTLKSALAGRKVRLYREGERLENRRLLFAFSLPESGVNAGLYGLLGRLRDHPGCLRGSVGGAVIDGAGDLYTKAAGRELILAASLAGCAFPGRPLAEATGRLQNFTVQARNGGCDLETAYRLAVSDLAGRVLGFAPPRRDRPRVLALHASSRATSNTLDLWGRVRGRIVGACAVREIGLRNGALEDCAGCSYTTCLHFGEQGGCFYGGVMVREVFPALRKADAVVLLCPNYNDALSANLTAAVNRLTALYRAASFEDKAVFALVVSGYSGGDIVASQVVSALCVNKGFWLPPGSILLETANDAGAALRLPGIEERLERFAGNLLAWLRPCAPPSDVVE